MPYSIRPAILSDLPDLVRIHKAAFEQDCLSRFSDRLVEKYYVSFLDRVPMLAGVRDGKLAGFVLGGEFSKLARCRRRFMSGSLPRAIGELLVHPGLWSMAARRFRRIVRGSPKTAPEPDFWQLTVLAVDPSEQGRGSARLLVEAFEAALDGKCEDYRLFVRKDNPRAIRFYEKLGFEIDHRRDSALGHVYGKRVARRADQSPAEGDRSRWAA